jgi:hypothetical protein
MKDVESAEKLIAEIKQIQTQYNFEVGSKGKPWPKSIRDRVFSLVDLGFSLKSISNDTGIPYYSILNWRYREREKEKVEQFQELALVPSAVGSVAVPQSCQTSQQSAAVTVTTPGGYRIEAMDASDVIKILKAMGGG